MKIIYYMKLYLLNYKLWILTISMLFGYNITQAQTFPNTEAEFKALYAKNIKKSRINDVYIPKNIEDAFQELENLSSPEARIKFKSGEENLVAQRLQRALGQWMIVNWNFYEGSRFSHHLKTMGITHPEDMAEFMIRQYHRHLNDKPLESDMLAMSIANKRKEIRKMKRSSGSIISEYSKKKEDTEN